MTTEILPRAREDIVAGYFFYEEQEQGIGSYSRDRIFAAVDGLRVTAGVHTTFHSYYRSLVDRFPHAIYYRIAGDVVQVHAILDCRRDPELLKETLGSR